MKIGILSDTHDHLPRTTQAISRLSDSGIQALIHCGDLSTPDIVYACSASLVPCHFVFGNCDYDRSSLRTAMNAVGATCWEDVAHLHLQGKHLAVTHGDSPTTFQKLLDGRPDFLLHGHTHSRCDRIHHGVRVINPGALVRADVWTVAVLDLSSQELQFLTIN